MRKHIVLIGLPGAGKTTAGALVAGELKSRFVDLDQLIEQEQGMPVREIFARRGERGFRALEREAAGRVFQGQPAVVAPGGGWATQPGAIEDARPRCCVVYLRTEPEVAAQRIGDTGTRPLLAGGDPATRMRELLAERERFYLRADAIVTTDGRSPQDVSQEVSLLARSQAGW